MNLHHRDRGWPGRWVAGWCLGLGLLAPTAVSDPSGTRPLSLPRRQPTADHEQFDELQQHFATGPDVTAACLGVGPVALIHTAGAFALLAFLIAHIYLTTTGETLTSNLQAMITGWETLPATPPPIIPSATVAKDAPSSGCQFPTTKGGSRS